MKIIRILTRLNIGGPSLHAAVLSTRLDPQRFQTCLVIGESEKMEGDLSGMLQGDTCRVVRLDTLRRPLRPGADFLSLIRLLRILWKERPEILHTHMAKAGALGRLAGILYNGVGPGRRPGGRITLIHTFHGHVLEGYFPAWASHGFIAIERWLACQTDCLIAVSPSIQMDLIKKRIGRPDQWRVVPLGLDLSSLSGLPFPNGSSPVRCGFVGRLVPIKNPSLFLQALGQAARGLPQGGLCARVIGDGPLRQELENQAKGQGISELVQFTGWLHPQAIFYENLDVVALTSWNEGTPVSLIEAMAAGRAVVATDVGGVRDLLADPEEDSSAIPSGQFQVVRRGILVRAGDKEGLAAALQSIARDPDLRRQLSQTARSYVLERFHHDRLVNDISTLYEELRSRG